MKKSAKPSSKVIPRFSSETLQFIRTAAKQKREDWIENHRAEYEALLLHPLQHLAQTLQERLGPIAPGYHFPVKGIGRIKRSKNRRDETGAVYKDWISYSASRPSGSRFEHNPNLYFGLDANDEDGDHVICAGGLYMPSSAQTKAIRHAIATDASPFEKLFKSKEFSSSFKGGFSLDRSATRPPRGYDANHPQIHWLKLQGFFVWRSYTKKEYTSAQFSDQVAQDLKQVLKLNELLDLAITGKFKAKSTLPTVPSPLVQPPQIRERKFDF